MVPVDLQDRHRSHATCQKKSLCEKKIDGCSALHVQQISLSLSYGSVSCDVSCCLFQSLAMNSERRRYFIPDAMMHSWACLSIFNSALIPAGVVIPATNKITLNEAPSNCLQHTNSSQTACALHISAGRIQSLADPLKPHILPAPAPEPPPYGRVSRAATRVHLGGISQNRSCHQHETCKTNQVKRKTPR